MCVSFVAVERVQHSLSSYLYRTKYICENAIPLLFIHTFEPRRKRNRKCFLIFVFSHCTHTHFMHNNTINTEL